MFEVWFTDSETGAMAFGGAFDTVEDAYEAADAFLEDKANKVFKTYEVVDANTQKQVDRNGTAI